MTSSLWWYAARGGGLVLLVVLTLTLLLGIAAGSHDPWRRGALLVHTLHRSMAMLSLLLLFGHALSATVDSYVAIAPRDVVVPFGSSFRPVPLGLGALAGDLLLVVVASSLARLRLPERLWRALHLLVYPAWVSAAAHSIVLGTDVRQPWGRALVVACAASLAIAAVGALVRAANRSATNHREMERVGR